MNVEYQDHGERDGEDVSHRKKTAVKHLAAWHPRLHLLLNHGVRVRPRSATIDHRQRDDLAAWFKLDVEVLLVKL
jgi:hypothetical protein